MLGKLHGLVVQRFQSHDDTRLKFHPGFNVICGANRVGKTALIRALDSVVEMGSMPVNVHAFDDTGRGEVAVRLIFTDCTITRRRIEALGKDGPKMVEQSYEMKVDGKVTKLQKTRSVPPQVAQILNMGAVDIDGVAIALNFHHQHDGDFLVSKGYSGATRLKVLGSIRDQHRLDGALRKAKAVLREQRSQHSAYATLVADTEQVARQLALEPDYGAMYALAAKAQAAIVKHEADLARLVSLRAALQEATDRLAGFQGALSALPSKATMDAATSLVTQMVRSQERIERLTKTRQSLAASAAQHQTLQNALAALPDPSEPWKRLQDTHAKLEHLTLTRTALQEMDTAAKERKLAKLAKLSTKANEVLAVLEDTVARVNHLSEIRERMKEAGQSSKEYQGRLLMLQRQAESLRGEIGSLDMCPFYDRVELQTPCRKALEGEAV